MPTKDPNNWWSGIVLMIGAAFVGRTLWLTERNPAGRRILSWEPLIEIPVLFAAILIGYALREHFDLGEYTAAGATTVLAYLGPKGTKEYAWRFLSRKGKRE